MEASWNSRRNARRHLDEAPKYILALLDNCCYCHVSYVSHFELVYICVKIYRHIIITESSYGRFDTFKLNAQYVERLRGSIDPHLISALRTGVGAHDIVTVTLMRCGRTHSGINNTLSERVILI